MEQKTIGKRLVELLPLLSVIFVIIWEFALLTGKVGSLEEKITLLTEELIKIKPIMLTNSAEINWIKSNCCSQAPVFEYKNRPKK
jgi:hypothetical protein